MKIQIVGLPGREYEIWTGDGILEEAGPLAARFADPGATVGVVSDETVWSLYGGKLTTTLTRAGFSVETAVLPPGEHNKTVEGFARLCGRFADWKLSRNSLVLALGGGVIGDLCGFAAAAYMRGIGCLQVPTTLLAQVDSSVGGKTAVNLPQGKNLVGAFHQPKAVLADTATLATLSPREQRCGMAEIVKYGCIRSMPLFRRLGEQSPASRMPDIIAECCRIKSEVVARDELEHGERMHLNFGHTFGHAIERRYGFFDFNHGEAVAAGMVIAAEVGEAMSVTVPGTADEIRRVLRVHELPIGCGAGTEELLPAISHDKKSRSDGIRLVLLEEIGRAVVREVELNRLGELMRKVEHKWKTER